MTCRIEGRRKLGVIVGYLYSLVCLSGMFFHKERMARKVLIPLGNKIFSNLFMADRNGMAVRQCARNIIANDLVPAHGPSRQ